MYSFCDLTINFSFLLPPFLCSCKHLNMKNTNDKSQNRDNSKEKDEKDITDALDRIIKKAKVENKALQEMLNKINPDKSDKS